MDTVAYLGLLTILGIGVLTPGPNAITCFAHSGLYGPKSNIKLIAGMVIGFITIELSVGLLVDALKENDSAMIALHWVGMAFLAGMIVAMFRMDLSSITTEGFEGALGLKTGIFMQFINGKEWAFVIIMMNQFTEPLGGGLTGIFIIIATTLTVCLVAMIAWTFAGARLNNMFTDPVKGPRVFNVCASMLTLLFIFFIIKGPATVGA